MGRGLITGKLGRWDNVGCVIVLAALCALAVAIFSGCASLGPIRVCASKDKLSACVDIGAPRPGAVAPVNLPLPGALTPQSADLPHPPGARLWVSSHGRFAVWPADAVGVQIAGEYAVPEDLQTLETAGDPCSSEDPRCFWPAPSPRTEASCYDPWAGRCHPWEEAVRLGIVPPDAPFATIALHDPRLAPCWRSAVGRAPSDPGQLAGRVTGTCGAEWESWWLTQGLPALAAAGRTGFCGSRGEALMATWECPDKCEARVLAEPGGAGLTPEHRTILRAADFPAFPVGDSVQVATWGCPWFVTVEGASPPPCPPGKDCCPAGVTCGPECPPCAVTPPPPGPCPVAGESCRPPCPADGPACPDLAKRIGEEIAAATADHRANSARLLQEILSACQTPCEACPQCPPPTSILSDATVAKIADATEMRLRLHTDALLSQIGLLQRAVEDLKALCKPGPAACPAGQVCKPADVTPPPPPPPGVFRFEAKEGSLTFREKLSGPGTARQVVLRAAFTPSTKLASGQHAQVLWLTTGKHKGGTLLALVCTGRGDCRIWQNLTPEKTQSRNVAMPLLPGVTYQITATYDTVAGRLGVGIAGGGKAAGLEVEAVKVPISFELLEVMGSSSVAGDLRWPPGSKWEVAVEVRP